MLNEQLRTMYFEFGRKKQGQNQLKGKAQGGKKKRGLLLFVYDDGNE